MDNYKIEDIISEITNPEFWNRKNLNRSKIHTVINNYAKKKNIELPYSSCFTYRKNKGFVCLSPYLLKFITINIFFEVVESEDSKEFEPLKFSTLVKYSFFEIFYKNQKIPNMEQLFKVINNSLIEELNELMKKYHLTKDEIINILSSDN